MKDEKKFCGYNWSEIGDMLNLLCVFEDDILITEEEQKAINFAIQCVTQIMNRMIDGKGINWD